MTPKQITLQSEGHKAHQARLRHIPVLGITGTAARVNHRWWTRLYAGF